MLRNYQNKKRLFLDLSIPTFIDKRLCLPCSQPQSGLFFSPGHVSPLRAMTNVNPAGTHQAVAKMLFNICPLIYKEKILAKRN